MDGQKIIFWGLNIIFGGRNFFGGDVKNLGIFWVGGKKLGGGKN